MLTATERKRALMVTVTQELLSSRDRWSLTPELSLSPEDTGRILLALLMVTREIELVISKKVTP